MPWGERWVGGGGGGGGGGVCVCVYGGGGGWQLPNSHTSAFFL